MSTLDDVEVTLTHGLMENRVYVTAFIEPGLLDEWREDLVSRMIERLAEDVGLERAETGTLHEYLGGQNGIYVKVVLVAAPA